MKHTPPIWTVMGYLIRANDPHRAGEAMPFTVCTMGENELSKESNMKNARLIAAAPFTLKALEDIVGLLTLRLCDKDFTGTLRSHYEMHLKLARAAVAEARGEQEDHDCHLSPEDGCDCIK